VKSIKKSPVYNFAVIKTCKDEKKLLQTIKYF